MIQILAPTIQIILAAGLTSLILLQPGNQNDNSRQIFSSPRFQKRGWEKATFIFTIAIFGLFLISSIVQTLV